MRFDQAKGYFVNCGTTETIKNERVKSKIEEDAKKVHEIFKGSETLSYRDLTGKLETVYSVGTEMAKKKISAFVRNEILSKKPNGYSYSYNQHN
jgi:hypothetical protein